MSAERASSVFRSCWKALRWLAGAPLATPRNLRLRAFNASVAAAYWFASTGSPELRRPSTARACASSAASRSADCASARVSGTSTGGGGASTTLCTEGAAGTGAGTRIAGLGGRISCRSITATRRSARILAARASTTTAPNAKARRACRPRLRRNKDQRGDSQRDFQNALLPTRHRTRSRRPWGPGICTLAGVYDPAGTASLLPQLVESMCGCVGNGLLDCRRFVGLPYITSELPWFPLMRSRLPQPWSLQLRL